MTILSLPALVMAVIAFYVASYHLLIYFRRREHRVDLTFAITALCVGLYDVFCAALYNVASPVEGVQMQRWQLISLAFLSISYAWFVFDYASMKSKIGPWLFTVIFSAFALIGLFDKSGLAWTDTPLIKNFQFPYFGWNITYYEMEFGLAMLFEAFMLMAFYLYLYFVAVHFYWKKNPKRAIPLVLAIAIFMLGMTEDVFVALGYYKFIYTIEYSFMGMVLVMAFALSSEIVERSKIKKELLESEEKFRALADTSPLAIYMSEGIEQKAVYINPTFTELFGYTIDEVPSADHWWPLAYPDEKYRSQVTEEWRKKVAYAIETSSKIEPMEVVVTCKDGSKKNILWNFITIGKQNWLCGLDLTERKQAEDALYENKVIFQSFLENSPVYIFFKDHEIRPMMLSKNFEQMLGMPLEDIIGKTMDDLFPSNMAKKMIEDDKQILCEGKNITVVEQFAGRTYETTKFPIFIKNKPNMLAGFTLDITDRQRAEEEKNKLQAQLRHSQKMEAIGTLSGGIAHDFNNILAAILGYADMARDDIPEWSPAKHQVEEVLKAGNRAKELVKQILAFSRKAEQNRVPVQIDLLIKEALNFLRASIPTTIDFNLSINPNCGYTLADPTQIHQVLMNICTNAAHAMEENGGVLSIDLSVIDMKVGDLETHPNLQAGPYIVLAISDTGTGIEKEHLDRIFDPYFTTKEVGKGSGMGLAVVHGIVRSHEGLISVESSVGQGTTFKLYFPKIEEKEEKSEVVDTSALPKGNENILIVDDDASIANLSHKRLERLGYRAKAINSSTEALELFRAGPSAFDLVITDQTMPKMTGETLAKELLTIRNDIPIILCTGYSSKINADRANSIGIKAFVMKPVDNKALSRTVRQVLDERR